MTGDKASYACFYGFNLQFQNFLLFKSATKYKWFPAPDTVPHVILY